MELNKLTNKKNVILTTRGNRAILQALRYARTKHDTLYLADQGDWITYEQYGKKLKFKIIELKTKRGIINFDDVKKGVVLFNDMPAYAFMQNKIKRKNDVLYIADITGSIGKRIPEADIIVCSFGKNKMINLGYGGIIASDNDLNIFSDFDIAKMNLLNEKIENLPNRLKKLKEKREEIFKKIKFNVIGKEINILVKFKTEKEKEKIIEFCEDNKLDYKECPMKIKVLEKAISIEIQNS